MSVPDKHCTLWCQRPVFASLALSPPASTSKRCERTEQSVLNSQTSKDVAEEDAGTVFHTISLFVVEAQWREAPRKTVTVENGCTEEIIRHSRALC